MSPDQPADRDPSVAAARDRVAATDFSDPAEAKMAAEAMVAALEALDDLVSQRYRMG
jgi:hypothetical protein